ncbi:hypothetical protein [Sphingomonas montana]|uniref:hypothetical protein n=1 Tax=Sphingomonas montana TaxID=1843236 RepID=UPI00096CFE02|nr:hypothetical protein [Sphingomonas montana]
MTGPLTGLWTGPAIVAAMLLTACGDGGASNGGDAPAANSTLAEPVAPVTNATVASATGAGRTATQPETAVAPVRFVGTWTGPEGLSFVAEPAAGGGFHVRNQDTLDDRTTFDATAEGGTLRFVRRGQALVARPGTGAETGFKWLANKRDCLIVQAGVEGYCRD